MHIFKTFKHSLFRALQIYAKGRCSKNRVSAGQSCPTRSAPSGTNRNEQVSSVKNLSQLYNTNGSDIRTNQILQLKDFALTLQSRF